MPMGSQYGLDESSVLSFVVIRVDEDQSGGTVVKIKALIAIGVVTLVTAIAIFALNSGIAEAGLRWSGID